MKLQVVVDFIQYVHVSLKATFSPPFRGKETLQQFEFVAWQSLPVILFCVSFAAIVTIIESSFHMKLVVQNDSLVPGFAALLILRELGVVVSSLLLTSRVGAGLAAEVGSMQITEQVDALRMLGIDPIRFLVVPRLVACVAGGAVLSLIANVVWCGLGHHQCCRCVFGYDHCFRFCFNVFVFALLLIFRTASGGEYETTD
jgi:phospholipid/cholesterol/gamma-HCH transport system permease protein